MRIHFFTAPFLLVKESQLLFPFLFIGYFFQHDGSSLFFCFESIFFGKMLRVKDDLHSHAIQHFIDGMLCLI